MNLKVSTFYKSYTWMVSINSCLSKPSKHVALTLCGILNHQFRNRSRSDFEKVVLQGRIATTGMSFSILWILIGENMYRRLDRDPQVNRGEFLQVVLRTAFERLSAKLFQFRHKWIQRSHVSQYPHCEVVNHKIQKIVGSDFVTTVVKGHHILHGIENEHLWVRKWLHALKRVL